MADDGLSRLTDDEKTALLALLKRTINDDRYPLSPRIGMLRDILAKLQGSQAGPNMPLPPMKVEGVRPATRHGKTAAGPRLATEVAVDFGLGEPRRLAHIRRASVHARGIRKG
jgi:hypothetical protein